MKDDLRERQEYTALRESWGRFREKGLLSEQWAEFDAFFDWAVGNGYCKGSKVMRLDRGMPASPENCYLILPDGGIGGIRGGYQNRPCRGCSHDAPDGCVCYAECRRYTGWINKCWEDFREAARRKGWVCLEEVKGGDAKMAD